MTVPTKTQQPSIEEIITKGNLSGLTPEQRTEFYIKLCKRHGLDELTQPFDWLVLNGRLTLYANRRCADQLRKINGISIKIVSQEQADGLLTIHVQAKDKDAREDEDLGVVSLPDTLKGEARANTILKAVTKAKRRVTLSISGLGFLDESEVDDIPASAKEPPQGVVVSPAVAPPSKAAAALVDIIANAEEPIGKDVKVDPDTGELPIQAEDFDPESVGKDTMTGQAWRRFGEQMVKLARAAKGFTPEQQAKMSLMLKERPGMYRKMKEAIVEAQQNGPAQPPQEPVSPVPQDDPDNYRIWLIDQISRFDTAAELNGFFTAQQKLWEPCFPPDIEDWQSLFRERAGEFK